MRWLRSTSVRDWAKNFPRTAFSARRAAALSPRASGSSIRSTAPPISRAAFRISPFRSPSNPAIGETYFARRGRGATRNDAPIRAAPTKDLDTASVELGWSPRIGNDAYVRAFGAILAAGANVRRSASGTLGLAYVADGRSDAYAELHINSWDCLAGLLIAREAGARINAFLAGGGLTNGNPVLAAAPGIAVAIANATGIPLPDQGDALSIRPPQAARPAGTRARNKD
jgi:hypothetical protein